MSSSTTTVPTCVWTGASGKTYEFFIYTLPASFSSGQIGNYIYARLSAERRWIPIYIGEGDLAERSGSGHHKASCIQEKGATHFHCHLNSDQHSRLAEEADLLANYTQAYEPVGCNERLGG